MPRMSIALCCYVLPHRLASITKWSDAVSGCIPTKTTALSSIMATTFCGMGRLTPFKSQIAIRTTRNRAGKECPKCQTVVHAAYTSCPDCGFEFPPPERDKHNPQASGAGHFVRQNSLIPNTKFRMFTIPCTQKQNAPDDAIRDRMRVDYQLGLNHWQSEWVCFEHSGFARRKAIAWWKQRSPDPVPDTAQRAVEIAEAGGIASPIQITVRSESGQRFDRIIDVVLGEMPEPVPVEDVPFYDESEIPF